MGTGIACNRPQRNTASGIIGFCMAGLLWAVPAAASGESAAARPLPLLSITLAPGGIRQDGNPAWVDLSTRIEGLAVAAGKPFLKVPVKFAGVPAVAYGAADISAADRSGALQLVESVDKPDAGGFIYWKRWTTRRATAGRIELHYRAPITLVVPRLGAGPPFDLRAQGGGFSGAGNTFLILPDTTQPFRIEIHWNLAALAPGSFGVSSLGEGDAGAAGPIDRLIATYFMAGPLGRYRSAAMGKKFSGFWIGKPQFDASALLAWSEKAYRAIATFFGESDPPPFRVLLRGNPYPGGGGAALSGSFLATFPDTLKDASELRETIAHETVHNWISSIAGPPGSTSWYSEGMTVYFTRLLLLRSGLFTPAEFIASVNGTALTYYTNVLNTLPNDDIAAGFWRDTRIRSLPYARGSLYFAKVDAEIRQHSKGARSLDDLALKIVGMRRKGATISAQTWLDAIVSELGAEGKNEFEAMLAGKLIVPPDDAFGPCFHRHEAKLRQFDLGFDRASLTDEPRIVRGLKADSAAARAGLRDGDEILQPVTLEQAQSKADRKLDLNVRRGDRRFTVEFLPRGAPINGYQWVRDARMPDSACRY